MNLIVLKIFEANQNDQMLRNKTGESNEVVIAKA